MKTIDLVKQFHETFGHPISNTPILPNKELNELRYELVREENEEGKDSLDLVDLADALGDLQYVIDGWFLVAGLHMHKDVIVKEIHRSNMSKSCSSEEEALKTIENCRDNFGNDVGFYSKKVGDRWIVYREDGKVMKSINYFKPDLNKVLRYPVRNLEINDFDKEFYDKHYNNNIIFHSVLNSMHNGSDPAHIIQELIDIIEKQREVIKERTLELSEVKSPLNVLYKKD